MLILVRRVEELRAAAQRTARSDKRVITKYTTSSATISCNSLIGHADASSLHGTVMQYTITPVSCAARDGNAPMPPVSSTHDEDKPAGEGCQ